MAVASSDESSSSSSVAESNSGAVAVEGMAAAAVAESSLGAGAEGTGTEEVVDVQVPEWKVYFHIYNIIFLGRAVPCTLLLHYWCAYVAFITLYPYGRPSLCAF